MSIRLIINDTEIRLNKGSYKEYPRVIENRNETEAGTTHRDIVKCRGMRMSLKKLFVIAVLMPLHFPSSIGRRVRLLWLQKICL